MGEFGGDLGGVSETDSAIKPHQALEKEFGGAFFVSKKDQHCGFMSAIRIYLTKGCH